MLTLSVFLPQKCMKLEQFCHLGIFLKKICYTQEKEKGG